MLKCIEGIYRNGKVELVEVPGDVSEARVIVAFLPPEKLVDLRARGIDEKEAEELRWRFGAVADDWDRPEMAVYDEL